MTAPGRMLLGFLSAILAVLVFQQASWALLHVAGLMPPAFPTRTVPPYDLPQIANLCFWGGLWGAALGLLLPRLGGHWFLAGIGLGVISVLVGRVVANAIQDTSWEPILGTITGRRIGIGLALNIPFGIGTAGILRFLIRHRRDFRR